jgi:hypothetical protein
MGPSRYQCPYDTETWALNMGYLQIAGVGPETDGKKNGRIDKIFMVHKQVYTAKGQRYFEWQDYLKLHKAGVEMYNIHEVKCEGCWTEIPFSKFPLDEIIEKLDLGYFSDTVCYMLAYALYDCTEGSKKDNTLKLKYPLKLRLYGVDLQDKAEYGEEKGGVECWIGYALGLGADVEISRGSTLLMTTTGKPYGMEPMDYRFLDPYTILTTGDNRFTEEEFEARKDEVFAAIENMTRGVYPGVQKYTGEGADGMHRDTFNEVNVEPETQTS